MGLLKNVVSALSIISAVAAALGQGFGTNMSLATDWVSHGS